MLAPWQATASKLTHYALYALMVLAPLSGYLTASFHKLPVQLFGSVSLNGEANAVMFELLRAVHSVSVTALFGLIILHVGAVVMHKIILKDGVASTMRPWFAK